MNPTPDVAEVSQRATINDCWNQIGVRGDSSCPELQKYIHCRNCPLYSAAAVGLLDATPPPGYLASWTHEIAAQKAVVERHTDSTLIFRVGPEWLALPTAVLTQIASLRTIHTVPHRRDGAVLGVANIGGELLVCFSLSRILGIEPTAAPVAQKQRIADGRLLVVQRDGRRAVFPTDEVYGIHQFHRHELVPAPATVARAAATYTRSVLPWHDNSVGVLDDQLLFQTLNRSLA